MLNIYIIDIFYSINNYWENLTKILYLCYDDSQQDIGFDMFRKGQPGMAKSTPLENTSGGIRESRHPEMPFSAPELTTGGAMNIGNIDAHKRELSNMGLSFNTMIQVRRSIGSTSYSSFAFTFHY